MPIVSDGVNSHGPAMAAGSMAATAAATAAVGHGSAMTDDGAAVMTYRPRPWPPAATACGHTPWPWPRPRPDREG